MRAVFASCGLDITLYLDDKEKGERGEDIECLMLEWMKPKLVLHVVDEVKERGFMEEPGFHIVVEPKGVGPEFRTRYDIFLSKERFHALTNPSEDPVVMGGYFGSRSMYDRIDIKYFGLRSKN